MFLGPPDMPVIHSHILAFFIGSQKCGKIYAINISIRNTQNPATHEIRMCVWLCISLIAIICWQTDAYSYIYKAM